MNHIYMVLIGFLSVAGLFAVLAALAAKFGTGTLRDLSCLVIRFWQDWLDSLNTDGGHILALILLVLVGLIAEKFNFAKADDVFIGAFTALLILLKSAGSNKTRRDTPAPPAAGGTVTTTTGESTTTEVTKE